jgi:hypothetical protein
MQHIGLRRESDTGAVLAESARENKLTNFRFVPIEEGANYASKGLDYL